MFPSKALGRQPLWEISHLHLAAQSRQTLTTPTSPPPFRNKTKTKTAIFKSEGTVHFGEQAPGLRLRGNSLSPSKQPLFGTTEKRGELNSDQISQAD